MHRIGEDVFAPAAISAAVDQGIQLVQRTKPKFKNSRYTFPHRFRNREKLSFPSCTGALYEHPILVTGGIHPGGRGCFKRPTRKQVEQLAGEHRVVFEITGSGSGKFCGAITHTKALTRGFFVRC